VELQFTGWYYKAVDNVVFEAAVLKRDADTLKAQSENRTAVEEEESGCRIQCQVVTRGQVYGARAAAILDVAVEELRRAA
jgi:hypothetical protein